MHLEEHLYVRLAPLVGERVFLGVASQGTAQPYVTYSVVGGTEGFAFAGPDGSVSAQVQIACWSADHPEALNTAKSVFDELTNDAGVGFGCAGVQNLGTDRDPQSGLFGVRWEYSLIPEE